MHCPTPATSASPARPSTRPPTGAAPKPFGGEDDKGYLYKYSIADSISDGTTLPLYYNLAPNDLLVPHETLDKVFLSLAEAEGLADIEHLNKVLARAVNLKNFLKCKDRIFM